MESYCCPNASLHIPHLERIHFRFSRLDEIVPIIAFVTAHCPHPYPLSQGLSELMVNAIEHGNLGICYDEKSELLLSGEWENEIERRLALSHNQGKFAILNYAARADSIILTIRDQGNGFDWRPYMTFSDARGYAPNGRGIAIAKSLAIWNITYQGSGNRVVCRVKK